MTKICYVISDIDKAVYFEQTAFALRKEGIAVSYVLINCSNKNLHHFLEKEGFPVLTIEAGSLTWTLPKINAVKRWLKSQQITLVHCHLAHANWIGLWAAKFAGIKTRIYTRHSGEPLTISWKERFIDKIQNKLASKVVSISQVIDDLLSHQGLKKSKRVLIHHGFQLELFENPNPVSVSEIRQKYNPENAFPVIGINARWMEWKGIQYIIPAFIELLTSYPNARLCIFGGQPGSDYYSELKEMLSKIEDRNKLVVEFEKDVYSLYSLFDIYVHTPVNPTCEAFGQTYIEALAAGVPSVFTLSGVAREFVVHKKNALVVPFKSPDEIHLSLLQIISDKESTSEMVSNGKKDVHQLFDFEQYIQKLIVLYNEKGN